MPAPPLSNTLEGGSDGTQISVANSGGASGNAFSSVTNPTIQTFSSTQAAHGSLSSKIAQTGTATSTRVDWTGLGSFTTDVWFRFYLFLPASPASGQPVLAAFRNSAAALCAELSITTGRLIRVNTAGGTVAGLNGTVACPTGAWCRIEFRCIASATVGQFEWRLYNTPDSTSIDETKSATSLNTLANIDQVRFGQATNPVANFTTYMDDFAVSSSGWIGPAASAGKAGAGISAFASGGADVATDVDTGAATSGLSVLGADVFTDVDTGAAVSAFGSRAAKAFTEVDAGSGSSTFTVAGAKARTDVDTGSAISALGATGAKVYIPAAGGSTYTKTGAGTSAYNATGADVLINVNTGQTVTVFTAAGVKTLVYAEAGKSISDHDASGRKAAVYGETGNGITTFVGAGTAALTPFAPNTDEFDPPAPVAGSVDGGSVSNPTVAAFDPPNPPNWSFDPPEPVGSR